MTVIKKNSIEVRDLVRESRKTSKRTTNAKTIMFETFLIHSRFNNNTPPKTYITPWELKDEIP